MCKLHLCAEHVQATAIPHIMRNMCATCVRNMCCLHTCMLQVCCTSVSCIHAYYYSAAYMPLTHMQATSVPHMCSLHTCMLQRAAYMLLTHMHATSNIGTSLNRQSSRDILNIYNWVWLWVWLGHAVVFLTDLSHLWVPRCPDKRGS